MRQTNSSSPELLVLLMLGVPGVRRVWGVPGVPGLLEVVVDFIVIIMIFYHSNKSEIRTEDVRILSRGSFTLGLCIHHCLQDWDPPEHMTLVIANSSPHDSQTWSWPGRSHSHGTALCPPRSLERGHQRRCFCHPNYRPTGQL